MKLSTAKKYIGSMSWPVKGYHVTSEFGTRWGNFHEGVDITAPKGEEILAAHAGKVVYANDNLRGYGNLIVIKGEGLITVYGHNRSNHVDRGDYVEKGDYIADVGASGKATGPHLHFETRIRNGDGKYAAVDPMVFFP